MHSLCYIGFFFLIFKFLIKKIFFATLCSSYDLSSSTRIESMTPAVEEQSPNTGPPGKSLHMLL